MSAPLKQASSPARWPRRCAPSDNPAPPDRKFYCPTGRIRLSPARSGQRCGTGRRCEFPAFAHLQRAAAGQRVLRADPRRKTTMSVRNAPPSAKFSRRPSASRTMAVVALLVCTPTPRATIFSGHRRPAVIQLDGHQVRGKLHHLRLQPQLFQGVGRLQPEQPAADNHPLFAAAAWAAIRSRSSRVR